MMKRILVFSDTHGETKMMKKVIDTIADIDVIVHCGDYTKDAIFLRQNYPDILVKSVRGNNEHGIHFDDLSLTFVIDNVKIYVTHGHIEGVKSGIDTLKERAKAQNADVCLFGHTHRKYYEKTEGRIFLNPGATRGFDGSYGVVEIEDGKASACFIDIN